MNKIARKPKFNFSKLNHEKLLNEIIINFDNNKITFDKLVKIQIYMKKLEKLNLTKYKNKLLILQDYINHYLFNVMYINLTILYNQMTDINFIIKKENEKKQQLYYYIYHEDNLNKPIINNFISKISNHHLFIMITNYKNNYVLVKIKDIYLYNLFFKTFALMYQIKYKIFNVFETPYKIFNNYNMSIIPTIDSKLTLKNQKLTINEFKYIPIDKNKNSYKNYTNNYIPGETTNSKLKLNLLDSSSDKEKIANKLFYNKDIEDIVTYIN